MSEKHKGYLIGLAVITVYVLVEYFNPYLRRQISELFGKAPSWIDHIALMMTPKLIIATLIGWKVVGLKNLFLAKPMKKGWLSNAILYGFALVFFLIAVSLQTLGALAFQFKLDPLLMVGNLFSNFYEEYVYRCVLIAVLTKCFSSSKFALVCSAIIFTLGHLSFPWILLAVVFLAGLLWGSLVLRFKSIFPAWISHCIADFIADTIFVQ